jgi:hypothetical protein
VSVPSSELGLPQPLSRKRLCPPPPRPKGGGEAHSPAAKGVGESQFRRLEKNLALCLLCGSDQKLYEYVSSFGPSTHEGFRVCDGYELVYKSDHHTDKFGRIELFYLYYSPFNFLNT